jgi:hypothetical protein
MDLHPLLVEQVFWSEVVDLVGSAACVPGPKAGTLGRSTLYRS